MGRGRRGGEEEGVRVKYQVIKSKVKVIMYNFDSKYVKLE